MAHSSHRLPATKIELNRCKAANPAVEFHVSLFLVEIFVPTNDIRTDLPIKLQIRGICGPSLETRQWNVPFDGNGPAQLKAQLLREHASALGEPDLRSAIFAAESIRIGIERCLLDWVGSHMSVRVGYLPGEVDYWRIDLLFLDHVIGRWKGDQNLMKTVNFFVPIKED